MVRLKETNKNRITYVTRFVLLVVFLVLPFFVSAQPLAPGEGIVPCTGWDRCQFCEFSLMLDNFVRFALFNVGLPVGVLGIIAAGVIFLTASGNQQRLVIGKKAMRYVVMGLLIAFAAWLIVDLTLGNLLDPGYKPWEEFPDC